jgi:hypothetical protein
MLDVTFLPDAVHFFVLTQDEVDGLPETTRNELWPLERWAAMPLFISRRLTYDEILRIVGQTGSWDYALPQAWWDAQRERHRNDKEPHPSEFVWLHEDRRINPDASISGRPLHMGTVYREFLLLIQVWAIGTTPETIRMEKIDPRVRFAGLYTRGGE